MQSRIFTEQRSKQRPVKGDEKPWSWEEFVMDVCPLDVHND